MKRIALGLFAALISLGSMTTQAHAGHRYGSDGRYDHSDRYDRYEDRYDNDYGRRYKSDPLYRALRHSSRVLLNNYFDGHRYRDANQWLAPHQVRFAGKSWGGGYRVWFRGQYHEAYTRWYRGKLCLYIGKAPTGPGYRYEIVID